MIILDGKEFGELAKKLESIVSDSEIKKCNKEIITKCVNKTKPVMSPKIPKSEDLSKSGAQHKGSRRVPPSAHSRDSVPAYVKTQNGQPFGIVGWAKGSNEENFYAKFVNWGRSEMLPVNFIDKTENECRGYYYITAEEGYRDLIKKME